MSNTSALGHAANIVGGWAFFAVCIVGSIVYFDDLRAAGRWALGVPNPDEIAAVARPHADESQTKASAPSQSSSSSSGSTVELRADRLGHFSTSAQVNGSSIDVMVDTGASIVALTWEDAQRAGIYVGPADFTHRVNTANGLAKVAPITISSISIGGITVRDVKGTVSEPGRLNGTLLGMTFLGRLSRAELRRNTLVLEE
jgi:aspartyl protease family protein